MMQLALAFFVIGMLLIFINLGGGHGIATAPLGLLMWLVALIVLLIYAAGRFKRSDNGS